MYSVGYTPLRLLIRNFHVNKPLQSVKAFGRSREIERQIDEVPNRRKCLKPNKNGPPKLKTRFAGSIMSSD